MLCNLQIEHIIREDRTNEVYEIVSLMCELLVERLTLISTDKVCPADLVASITTIIWAAPRLEVPELTVVTKQFGLKYGKDFVRRARQNSDGLVDEKIMSRLSIQVCGRPVFVCPNSRLTLVLFVFSFLFVCVCVCVCVCATATFT